jgi:hypothetical protein
MHVEDGKCADGTSVLESSPELKKHAHAAELSADSVGARLRLGRENGQIKAMKTRSCSGQMRELKIFRRLFLRS